MALRIVLRNELVEVLCTLQHRNWAPNITPKEVKMDFFKHTG